jgi:hypothetical protein
VIPHLDTRGFEDALDVSPLPNGSDWLVTKPFHYDTNIYLGGPKGMALEVGDKGWFRIEVPTGFVTDFASIPRFFWRVIGAPAEGKYRLAAVVHDYLYRTPGICMRNQADSVLREAMVVSGCSAFDVHAIYWGVRLGGWLAWNANRRAK